MRKGFALPLLVVAALFSIGAVIALSVFIKAPFVTKTEKRVLASPQLSQSVPTEASPIKSLSETTRFQLDFVSSKGIKKKLTVFGSNGTGFYTEDIFISEGDFDKEKSRRVTFATIKQGYKKFLIPVAESPGPEKYFFVVIGLGGDSGKSAIFDQEGKVISENIDENVNKVLRERHGEKDHSSPKFRQGRWIDSNTYSIRYAAYAEHDHEFEVKLSASGIVLGVEKINL